MHSRSCSLSLIVVAGLLIGATAHAADFGKRKAGLWEIHNSVPGMPGGGVSMQYCTDGKSDDVMQQSMRGNTDMQCSRQDIRREGARTIVDSVCRMGSTTATTHAVFTGNFDSNYRAEIKSTYEPPMMGMKEGTVVLQAKWLGPCKPGQKPGDMMMPNGMTLNPGSMPTNPRQPR